MEQIAYTSLMAGIYGLFFLVLTILVIKRRRNISAALGDKGDLELIRKQRAQGNFIEWAPLVLILMLLVETGGFLSPIHNYIIVGWGALFLLGRILHAYSMICSEKYDENLNINANPIFRVLGMVLSMGSVVFLSLWNIAGSISHLF